MESQYIHTFINWKHHLQDLNSMHHILHSPHQLHAVVFREDREMLLVLHKALWSILRVKYNHRRHVS
jgi:hypothetical protein